MKKILFSILLTAGANAALFAQGTLTAATNNPVVHDAFTTVNCDTTGTFVQATIMADTGANIVWNYTGLITMSYDTAVDVACGSTPYCSVVMAGTNDAQQTLSASSYSYSILATDSISQTGIYTPTTQILFTDPLKIMEYPFTYHSSFTDNYAGLLNTTISGATVTVHEAGAVSVYCDGYGKLMLPGGITDTNVVRVRSMQTAVDSANIFGLDSIITVQINTYEWFMPGYHSPLMSVTFTDQVGAGASGEHFKTISYALKYPLGVQDISMIENSLEIYPNPATSELNLKFNAPASEKVSVTLLDLLGRQVAVLPVAGSAGMHLISMNTNSFAKGVYLLRLQSGSETITRKVTIQ